jgi:hypothetical protein
MINRHHKSCILLPQQGGLRRTDTLEKHALRFNAQVRVAFALAGGRGIVVCCHDPFLSNGVWSGPATVLQAPRRAALFSVPLTFRWELYAELSFAPVPE